jgi:hypothetical protein
MKAVASAVVTLATGTATITCDGCASPEGTPDAVRGIGPDVPLEVEEDPADVPGEDAENDPDAQQDVNEED